MQVNAQTIQMRIDRIRHLIEDCPTGIEPPEDIRQILQTTPRMLQEAQSALLTNNPLLFEQLDKALEKTKALVTWATGTLKGQATAEAIEAGTDTDPSLPVEQRLLNRILKFMLARVDGPVYLELVREFSGVDAVDGDRVYMDPTGESEAFSQWLIHDIRIPGQPRRTIELFAEETADELPEDERALLDLRMADRPSVYKVIDLTTNYGAPGIYLVQDLLAPDAAIKIWDLSSSKTLRQGAIIMGRAIPYDEKTDLYNLLGSITELPDKLWAILTPHIDKWKAEYLREHPDAEPFAFYRAVHARLRRKIREITEPNESGQPVVDVKLSPSQKNAAEDIHKFMMKDQQKGMNLERFIASPPILKYMKKFKRLMDTCSRAEMDYLTVKYKGFYDFALLMEEFAIAIRDGTITPPEAYENAPLLSELRD